jgi:hypothetical protein
MDARVRGVYRQAAAPITPPAVRWLPSFAHAGSQRLTPSSTPLADRPKSNNFAGLQSPVFQSLRKITARLLSMKLIARVSAILVLSLSLISTGERAARASEDERGAPDPQPVTLASQSASSVKMAIKPEITERAREVRGIYFSRNAIAARGAEGTARFLKSAGLNAVVIDFKDSEGNMSASLSGDEPPTKWKPVTRDLLKQLDELGVHTIARIVCFSDPVTPRKFPHRAVMDGRPHKQGEIWANWGGRNTWLDPYNVENQQMVIDLARRAQELGFHEVQLDYIRFPVDEATPFAVFPAKTEHTRADLLTDLMRRVDEAIEIPLGVDVFGTTAFQFEPQEELGQDPARWAAHVQVFSPMLYMNKMGNYMAPGPRRAERLVRTAVGRMRGRIGPGPVIRPFLQAFERGADYYNAEFIAEQVRGAMGGGGNGFLFWDPSAQYAILKDAREAILSPLGTKPSR